MNITMTMGNVLNVISRIVWCVKMGNSAGFVWEIDFGMEKSAKNVKMIV